MQVKHLFMSTYSIREEFMFSGGYTPSVLSSRLTKRVQGGGQGMGIISNNYPELGVGPWGVNP